jgi:gas vesicle protein
MLLCIPLHLYIIQVLECPICNEQYGTEYDTTPRVLRCGHTYCTKCLAQLVSIHAGKRYGVKCAFCSSLHELSRPDPKLIPINHAVLEIIKISDSKRVDTKAVGPQCEYNGPRCEEGAKWVCFDCNPTKNNTLFCSTCIKTEHYRGFEPVTRHRRMLMAEVNNPHTAYCLYHPLILTTLYSIKLQQFACSECESSRPEFADTRDQFEPVSEAVQTLRSQAKRMVKYSQEILAKLNVTLGSISANNAELGPTVEQTKNEIQQKFSEIREIIQERQMTLMKHVQAEVCARERERVGHSVLVTVCVCVNMLVAGERKRRESGDRVSAKACVCKGYHPYHKFQVSFLADLENLHAEACTFIKLTSF